ncbi:unnamed protein product [Echinostoma caproni]|uniref:Neur_chan_LBD domain-containing protein n=1 Tax=Echinostoma caproni TaxID=27848 RepID=A0A183ALE3_9TREM|nr:unnamed protein product [Echinostoma caproni]
MKAAVLLGEVNSKDSIADERLKEHREARVVIHNDGSTLWVPQALFKSTCEVEITYFPFDTQICMLEFGSWTYDKTQMDIGWWLSEGDVGIPMPYLDFSDYVPSNEWRTDGEKERDLPAANRTIQIRSVKKYRRRNQTVGNQVLTREFPVLRYLVRLRRNPSFYVFMLVIPCVLLSSLTLVVFWLPPESPAKMMLGGCPRLVPVIGSDFMDHRIGAMLLFNARLWMRNSRNEYIRRLLRLVNPAYGVDPERSKELPSDWLLSTIQHLSLPVSHSPNVSCLAVQLVIEGIGRLLLVRQRIPLPDIKKSTTHSSPRTTSNVPGRREMSGSNFLMNESSFGEDSRTSFHGSNAHGPPGLIPGAGYAMFGDQIPYDVRAGGPGGSMPGPYGPGPGMLPKFPPNAGYFEPCSCGAAAREGLMGDPSGTPAMDKGTFGFQRTKDSVGNGAPDVDEQTPTWINSTAALERDVREVKQYVKAFVSRQKEMHRKSLVAMEWRTLALVLDRLFFVLYITTIVIAVVVSVPRSTEPELPEAFRETEIY